MKEHSIDRSVGRCRRDAAVNALDKGCEAADGAKDWVAGALVGPLVIFGSILLVFEGDRHSFR